MVVFWKLYRVWQTTAISVGIEEGQALRGVAPGTFNALTCAVRARRTGTTVRDDSLI